MAEAHPADDVAALPFERAMAELEDIVSRLEAGRVDLEESIALWERGDRLKKHCEGQLRRAEMRVQTITAGGDGSVTATPFDAED